MKTGSIEDEKQNRRESSGIRKGKRTEKDTEKCKIKESSGLHYTWQYAQKYREKLCITYKVLIFENALDLPAKTIYIVSVHRNEQQKGE